MSSIRLFSTPARVVRAGRRVLGQQGFKTFSNSSAVLLLNFGASLLLARWLGPHDRGSLAAATIWPSVLLSVASMGLFESITYHTARDKDNAGETLTNALLMATLQSIVVVPITYFLLPSILTNHQPDVIAAGRLFLIIIPIGLASSYCLFVLRGLQRFNAFNLIRLEFAVGYIGAPIVFHFLHSMTMTNIIWMWIAVWGLQLVLGFVTLWAYGVRPRLRTHWATLRPLIMYGLKVHLGSLSNQMNQRMDQMVLAIFVPSAQLGYYVVAVSMTNILEPLTAAFTILLLPSVAREKDRSVQVRRLTMSVRLYWIIGVGLTVVSVVVIPWGLPFIYGHVYSPSILPAEILVVASLLAGAKDIIGTAAQAMGNPWLRSISEFGAVWVTVVLLIVLLPSQGILGAAIASVAAYGSAAIMCLVYFHRWQAVHWKEMFAYTAMAVRRDLAGVVAMRRPNPSVD